MLDGTGLPGNECPPDLDLSGVAAQQVTVGQTLNLNLLASGATAVDLDEAGDPTGDTLRFVLDPDTPSQTPAGASITSNGVFTWTPTAGQVGTFSIVVLVVDQGTPALADAEVFTVEVLAGNQAPDIDLNGPESGIDFTATFTEDGGAVAAVDSTELTIADADDTELESAHVTITNLADGASELLAVDTTGTSITATYDDTTGVLTLTGTDTLANYQQVLRTLTYANSSQDPTEGDRAIDIAVNDGDVSSAVATSTITVTGENDAPVVDLNAAETGADFEATFTEGGGAVSIVDAAMTVVDVDDTDLESATVTITNLLDGAAELLAVVTTGTSITATYDDTTGVLTLSGTDTVAAYEQVLRTLAYDNSSGDPSTTARTIEVVVNDGTVDSAAAVATVTVAAVNDNPNLTLPAPYDNLESPVEVEQGHVVEFTVSATDVDNDVSELFYSIDLDGSGLPEGAAEPSISNPGGVFSWTPDVTGSFTFRIIVTDDADGVDQEEVTLTVVADTMAPTVANAPAGTLTAPINSLSITFSEAMGSEAFDVANYTLTIVGGANDGQVISISDVTTTDDTTAMLNLATDLAIESYLLVLDDADIDDLAGNLLDGDIDFEFAVAISDA